MKNAFSAIAACAMLLLSAALVSAADGTGAVVIPIWPGEPVGENAPAKPEKRDGKNGFVSVTNVWTPTIEVFPAPAANNTGAAVLICPGGGYSSLSYSYEGVHIAEWLNSLGITGVVLKYRVPQRPNTQRGELPLKDAQRALSLLRSRAAEWKIDPARIGILGFSAGGHLSALASTAPERTYAPADDADKLSCLPNFTVLIYPAYCVENGALSPRLPVTKKTPPALLIHAANDPYTCDSSLLYFSALRKERVSAEVHIYSKGGHGFGMHRKTYPVATWPTCAAAWLGALRAN
ncbi:MAG: alpha/beta hydrolase [Puniceicoccales bacterium]|jgi:acetyl esterase/lipase|nr:alpha/beta hydrolase [Puniceicoccales bacterium]